MRRLCLKLLLASLLVVGFLSPAPAQAQYKNSQFGFEVGYLYVGERTGLDPHGLSGGLRAAYKISDHWWFAARAGLSVRGDEVEGQVPESNTAVMLSVIPIEARYYFLTDFYRPYVGITNAFQFLFNTEINATVFWGPGVTAGIEIRLRRDMFLGFQADGFYMITFGVPDAPLINISAQLNFFL